MSLMVNMILADGVGGQGTECAQCYGTGGSCSAITCCLYTVPGDEAICDSFSCHCICTVCWLGPNGPECAQSHSNCWN